MPRRRFDKKTATTYNVVHRAHDDSLFYDNDVSKHVLVPAPTKPSNSKKKIYSLESLKLKLGEDQVENIRDNEGLAAQYGIFFDDSKYDYMQHLKPMGQSEGEGVFVEAKPEKESKHSKVSIEDLFGDQIPSEKKRTVGFDATQNIPDELQGFNPDLDPRLREVLEALEDEEYIAEAEEEKDFENLLQSGEVDEHEFYDYEDDEDWDLDNYDDISENLESDSYQEPELPYNEGEAPEELNVNPVSFFDKNWEKDFKKFKKDTQNQINDWDSDDDFEASDGDVVADLPDLSVQKSKKKVSNTKARKKKGALSDTSSFSMSSSALFRTDGLTLLDDRYEQLAKKFEESDQEEEYKPFSMKNERNDLEDMLDDFLDNYELANGGRKLVKKNEEKERIQKAADSVSKSKLAARRRNETNSLGKLGNSLGKLGNSFGNLTI
ncbi:uncharacterized protein PRCAT00003160001 [Priceomyces carsonii]|uniref:uncharacterized protein n=1 Tax=Priceomyces carsonii TaxID=28549 RepID=UPI002ED7BE09|nr:unnamed protein product [Priceomyces carsonii]